MKTLLLLTFMLSFSAGSQEYDESGDDFNPEVEQHLRDIQDEEQLARDRQKAVYNAEEDPFAKKDLKQFQERTLTAEEKAQKIRYEIYKSKQNQGNRGPAAKKYSKVEEESASQKAARIRMEIEKEKRYRRIGKKKRGRNSAYKCPPEVPDCLVNEKSREEKIYEAASDEANAKQFEVVTEEEVRAKRIKNTPSMEERAQKELREIALIKKSRAERKKAKYETVKRETLEEKAARIRREIAEEKAYRNREALEDYE